MSEGRSAVQPAGPGVFSAADINRQREAAKAAEDPRHKKEQEEKQKSLIPLLTGVS